ncbi:MAG: hypothetical protein GEV09_07915 [Pseudonocardiaceae bacterium]|nr:hypothetical protein [Pseudonocardiaceae bacterium]
MTRMLKALDVHDGHDVLEIVTGTGYNAALLAHRLGDTHAFSFDIDDELVDPVHAGNIVLLQRRSDRAEGRFDRSWAGFMALRSEDVRPATPTDDGEPVARDRDAAVVRTTDLDILRPWDNLVAWFLAQLSVPTYPRRADRPSCGCASHQRGRLLVRGQRIHRQRHPAGSRSRPDAAVACRGERAHPVARAGPARLGSLRTHRHP